MSVIGDRIALVRAALVRGLPSIGDSARLISGDGTKFLAGDGAFKSGGGGAGLILLTSEILSQVPFLDLDLPAGYLSYKLALIGFRTVEAGEDSLNFRLSFDGGSTFAEDNKYFTSSSWVSQNGGFSPNGSFTPHVGTDTQGELANGYPGLATPGRSLCGEFNIFPGSATLYPSVYYSNVTIVSDVDEHSVVICGGCVYESVVGRATTMRLSTFFGVTGDIAAGSSYALFGIPNPT